MFGHAHAFFVVGFDALRADVPRGVAFLAGVEFDVGEGVAVFVFQLGLFAHGLQTAAFAFGFHGDVFGAAAACGEVVLQLVAAHGGAAVVQNEAAAGADGVGFLVVGDFFGVEHLLVAFDDDIALCFDADGGLAAQIVGGYAGVVGRQCFFAAAAPGGFGFGGRLNNAVRAAFGAGAAQARFFCRGG